MALLLLFFAAGADETALSDDGREVRLMNDGTWEYVSDDRCATSEDGKRVRLSPVPELTTKIVVSMLVLGLPTAVTAWKL